ncbi:hypothetical protein H6F62_00005, partial [Anabaena sp. FACHB-1391]|nr:hypothetical protein [Anabaena sp. FACHB-1391]
MDFQPGIDTITLPKLTGNQAYRYTLVSGINGTGVEVAYNNQTNEPSTFLRIYIDPTLLPTVQGQSGGVTQLIESLFTNNATNGVIGTTRNNTSKVAVSGSSYTGTIAGDYIYVAQNNNTVGSVKIYGNAGDDLLAGRKNGTNEIYGGDGDDFIVPGGVNDTIDGGAGYDQVNYSQNAVGISITSSNSTNFKTVESVTGTVYNDTINYSDLQVAPDDGLPINLEGRAGNDSLVGSQYQDVIDGEDGNDTLIGGAGSDILKGGAGDDFLTGGLGKDTLTGALGVDRFDYRTLADSVFSNFDVINDFNANTDNDLFLVTTACSGFSNAGSVTTLDTAGITARLTNTTFTANAAVQFSFGSRTFVAINDATAGFSANNDAIIEVTGLTGTLGLNNFTTTNDIAPPTITLAVSPSSVTEDSTPNLIYTFTRTGATTNALTVNYGVTGTADSSDYTGATPGTGKTITFAAGASTATLTIDPTGDSTPESNETVVLTLASGTGYTVGTTTAVTGTITNDDVVAFPSITLAVSPSSVLENGTTNLIYTFTRTGATTNALTVNYGVTGTADSSDYTGATPGTGKTITFAAGASTATLTIDPTADTTVESNETVALTLATGTGYTIGTTTAVTGTINNDDFPTITLAVSPSSVTEDGTPNLIYTFTRTGATTNTLTVNYGIAGTADSSDYTGATPGTGKTITFAAGASTATLTIDPTGDSTPESDETVVLTLAS